jgi:protein SCO1/2
MSVKTILSGIFLATVFLLASPAAVVSHDGAHKKPGKVRPPAGVDQPEKARGKPLRTDENYQREYFTDLPLVTQDGKPVRFYTDILKGKVVLISFVYTNCTDVCPILMPNLAEIQDGLGDRFGRDVHFVSISVDPEDDTPEELKEYGAKYGAKPGWTFLTGKKENVDWVVYKLGQYAEDFEDHTMLFLLGDVRNGRWRKFRGDQAPETNLLKILHLLDTRQAEANTVIR